MTSNLLPDRHKDFFICDVFDSFKDDIASMEHPVFSLSTKPDHRMLEYEHNGSTIKIKPSYTGLATIFDKDILLYLASGLMNAKNNGESISQTVRFISYDYLVSTNKDTGGFQYRQMRESLARLNGTLIETNIKTNGKETTEEFGLINSWKVVKEDGKGKAVAIEVELSKWFYNSILGDEILSMDKGYFRLRKPTERRLYELARKHCGNQITWKIKLDNLKLKLGTVTSIRRLRFNLKALAESNHLPEYNISINGDVVIIGRKEDPQRPSKYISKREMQKHARPGENDKQVRDRIKEMKQAVGKT